MHDGSLKTTNARISHPYNTGMENVGFHRPGTLLVPSAKRREVLGESHEG